MNKFWALIIIAVGIAILVIYFGFRAKNKPRIEPIKIVPRFVHSKATKMNKRFTDLGEYYEAISSLIEWLNRDGHTLEAQKLRTSMVVGATGSEILGDIMLALKSMKGKYSPELRNEIDDCLEFALNHRKYLSLDHG